MWKNASHTGPLGTRTGLKSDVRPSPTPSRTEGRVRRDRKPRDRNSEKGPYRISTCLVGSPDVTPVSRKRSVGRTSLQSHPTPRPHLARPSVLLGVFPPGGGVLGRVPTPTSGRHTRHVSGGSPRSEGTETLLRLSTTSTRTRYSPFINIQGSVP